MKRTFAPDWPIFAGHFPQRPMVPGAELIRLSCEAAGAPLIEIVRFTFRAPLLPGDTAEFRLTQDGALTHVAIRVGNEVRAEGKLRFRQPG